MPDLIDREAAVRALRREAEVVMLDAICKSEEQQIASRYGYKFMECAVSILRALPAVDRRCATCREWQQPPCYKLPDNVIGLCYSEACLHGPGGLHTKADHYCAAWQARDSQP